jgi:hypothetical protein
MPTLFRKFGFRFYFLSYDCAEPTHIHISDDQNKTAKFWLKGDKGVILSSQVGFKKSELAKIEKEIFANFDTIVLAFDAYCKKNKK